MTKKEFRLFGFNLLIWTWKNEQRIGTKAKTGIGIIVERIPKKIAKAA